jgi:PKD repeat protein
MQRTLYTLLFLFGALSAFSQTRFQAQPIKLKTAELDSRFTRYHLVKLDAASLHDYARQHPDDARIELKIGNELNWNISLQAVDIRQADYQLVVQTEKGRALHPRTANKTYRGITLGSGPGPVRLTLDHNFIYGLLSQNETTHFIEPAWHLDASVPEGVYLVYDETDVVDQNYTCGTSHEHVHSESEKTPTAPEAARMMACLQLPTALAADFSIFQEFGSVASTENFMVGVLNNVQTNYDNEFNNEIDFEVAGFFISTCSSCDPWTSSTNAGSLLDSFTAWGNSGGFGFSYSIASLWTNRNFSGTTIGVAWVGGLCSNLRYNVLERFSTNASLLRVLQAHELGHNFNAFHDASGSPFIMAPSVNTSTQWSTASQNSINNFINFLSGQPGCFFQCTGSLPPQAIIQAPATHICPGSVVPFVDGSLNNPTSWDWDFQGGQPPSSTQQNPLVFYPDEGIFTVSLTVENSVGVDVAVLNTDITVDQDGTKYLLYETFENGLGGWTAVNPDNSTTWDIREVGGTQYGRRAAFMDNFNYNASGQVDALLSPTLSFVGESNLNFQMDYAYRRYNAQFSEQLIISISTDGGFSYDQLFLGQETGGGNFATSIDTQNEFVPNALSNWCYAGGFGPGCIALDLSSYAGEDNVRIKIENINDFGNNLYIDNIRITGGCQPATPPVASFLSDVTTGCAPLTVQFEDLSFGTVENWEWSFPGGTPSTSFETNPTVTYNVPGVYDVSLTVYNAAGADQVTLPAYISVDGPPTPDFLFDIQDFTVNFTDLSIDASSVNWHFGDGNTSNEPAPEHTYAAAGMYDVTLFANNSCGTDSLTQTVTIIDPIDPGFTADTLQGCPGLMVTYTDTTSGNPVSWLWQFEGGQPSTDTVQNPVVTYDTSGSFQTTLIVTTASGTSDTLTQNNYIQIDSLPLAGFDIQYTLGNTTAEFTNTSLHADSLYWDFGDGSNSTEENPDHDFGMDGSYTITLIAVGECGSDTLSQNLEVITLPEAGIMVDTTNGCAPLSITAESTSSSNTDSISWLAPGATPDSSLEDMPVFTYDTAGSYTLTLIATNEAGSDTATVDITVGEGPTAAFSFDYILGEATVSFTNQSSNADDYLWDFGNGNTSNEQDPDFDFGMDGIYSITLIASNECGNDTTTQQVEIVTLPTAVFTLTSNQGCIPFTVSPQENASANTDTWQWIADGATPDASSEQNPVFTYDTPGSYTLTLIVSNEAGSDTTSIDLTVGQGPTADFTFDYMMGETTVSFTNQSSNADDYLWDFGNGNTSNEQDPDFDFSTDGIYSITLIASNECGNDTTTQQVEIVTLPTAVFTLTSNQGCTPFTVSPQENASANTDTWQWIADGATPDASSEQNPVFTYDTPGSYTLTLIVSNEAGSDTTSIDLTVGQGPTADFTFDYTIGETTVSFTNQSSNADDYLWDFGNGNTSNEQEPDFDYGADGLYTVMLVAFNGCGNDTTTQQIEIITLPTAAFTLASNQGCTPFTISPQENASANTDTWQWIAVGATPDASSEQNPVFTYNTPGSYTLMLIASNEAGSDTTSIGLTVGQGPTADFTFDYTIGETAVNFTNQSSEADNYLWNFGNGNTSMLENPNFDFGTDGLYTVMLVALNGCGNDTTTQQVEIITAPVADFTLFSTIGCPPFTVSPQENASANTDTWQWIADGAMPDASSEQNPVFTYDTPGSYTLTLIASNEAGSDTTSISLTVQEGPTADFGFDYSLGASTVSFMNQSSNADSYLWDFGNGNTSTEANPAFDFGTDGLYPVVLISMNPCGSDTTMQQIEIITLPTAAFSVAEPEGCAPLSIMPQQQASANTDSWEWIASGATPDNSTDPAPVFVYNTPGTYTLVLVTANEAGADTAELDITVLDVPAAAFNAQVNGVTVNFQNTSSNATTFSWDFGDGNNSEEPAPVHTYEGIGTYIVQLTASNSCGSTITTDTIEISLAAPVAGFTAENNVGCAPLEVSFINTSQNGETYLWTFEGGTPASSTAENPTVTYDSAGVYPVTLVAINPAGSGALTQMDVVIVNSLPASNFTYITDVTTVNFFNNSQNADEYLWLFGDGTNSMQENPSHTYSEGGTYEVTLISINECGADTSTQTVVLEGLAPEPVIAVQDSTQGCAPFEVTFIGTSNGGEPTSLEWIFEGGNPATSTDPNPTVTYEEAGIYDVTLTMQNAFGMATQEENSLIEVQEQPEADFSVNQLSALEFSFVSNTSGGGLSYSWNLGDGNSSEEINPVHTYSEEGTYTVELTVSNKCGEAMASQEVIIVLDQVEDESWIGQLNLYPNPNNGVFTVEIQGVASRSIHARLFNVVGQSIEHIESEFHTGYWKHTFEQAALPSGVYILELTAGQSSAYRRIVID